MAYTYKNAIETMKEYLGLTAKDFEVIDGTKERGFVYTLNGESIVIFVYPISCKDNNRQNFFDTRDSGAHERKIAWEFARENNYKYFCLGVNSEQERYKDYILSLECDEKKITAISFRADESGATGTQVNIPADYIPSKIFDRILTPYKFYIAFIKKEYIKDYLQLFDNRPYIAESDSIDHTDIVSTVYRAGENVLLYGVPGSGKSKTIDTEYCNNDDLRERVVFHPDYTYSDFVGQILPRIDDGSVSYEFTPGPFTSILKKAVHNIENLEEETNNYYLIIEEINRGNAPAIFGDIFQLLDRDNTGESEYSISNREIALEVYGDENHKVKVPSNLFIIATMNTSDQNVFTLDTAFKRRWKMRHIRNDIDSCLFADHAVCGTDVSWGTFAKTINEMIVENAAENFSNEDNRLGAYFVREPELDDPEAFGEKVLMYLWNDAFKYDHDKVFKPKYRTLDELVEAFKRHGLEVFVSDAVFEFEANEDADDRQETNIDEYLRDKQDILVKHYSALKKHVIEAVPNLHDAATKGKNYVFWKADGLKKSGFADFKFQTNKIIIETESPRNSEWSTLGQELPKDGHHKHYFQIEFDGENILTIADILIDAYKQLFLE